MRRFTTAVVAVGLLTTGVSFAQEGDPPQMPNKVERFLDRFVGTWEGPGVIGVIEWDPGRNFLIARNLNDRTSPQSFLATYSWDGEDGDGILSTFLNRDSSTKTRFRITSDTAIEGIETGLRSGRKISQHSRVEFTGPDQFIWKDTEITLGGESKPDSSAIITRVKPTTREDFETFCRLNEGRWMGEITWAADWPGLGKKGDKVTVYRQNRISQDGNALLGEGLGGNGSGMALSSYDAYTQLIRGMDVSSGGSLSQTTVRRTGRNWVWEVDGVEADGTMVRMSGTATFSDDGKTLTEKGRGTRGDEKVEFVDVFHRVSK